MVRHGPLTSMALSSLVLMQISDSSLFVNLQNSYGSTWCSFLDTHSMDPFVISDGIFFSDGR